MEKPLVIQTLEQALANVGKSDDDVLNFLTQSERNLPEKSRTSRQNNFERVYYLIKSAREYITKKDYKSARNAISAAHALARTVLKI